MDKRWLRIVNKIVMRSLLLAALFYRVEIGQELPKNERHHEGMKWSGSCSAMCWAKECY